MLFRKSLNGLRLLALLVAGCSAGNEEGAEALPQPDAPAPGQASYLDVRYTTASNPRQTLDLTLPQATGGPYPVVILIHGGGWQGGTKDNFRSNPLTTALLNAGFAVAAINYRLSGEARFPAQIQDVKAAIRWVRAQAGRLPVDGSRIGVYGTSAGGHLAALAGLSGGVASLEDLTQGHSTVSSRVKAVAEWFGPTDLLQMNAMASAQGCPVDQLVHDQPDSPESLLMGYPIQSNPAGTATANPITYLTPDDPPFFIAHGLIDCTVPYGQSQLLYDRLVPVLGANNATLTLYPNSGHGSGVFPTVTARNAVVAFFQARL